MGEEFEREWIHVYVWPGPFAVHLKRLWCCLELHPHAKQKVQKEKGIPFQGVFVLWYYFFK